MLKFSTKAETLTQLSKRVTKCRVLPQLCFTVSELENSPSEILNKIAERFQCRLIVRSSALCEDAEEESMAGKFLSLADISPADVLDAMKKVAASYEYASENQILIQPMLTDIVMCGVLFTIDPNTGGNYFVINYDETGSSDAVTSGHGQGLITRYVFRGFSSCDRRIDRLTEAAEELTALFGSNKIDIEFAFDSSGELYLLQARPLAAGGFTADYALQKESLSRVHALLEREMHPKPFVKGNRTIYGVMPDWNPAEMIGTRPKPLSLSLYKRLITDGTWAYQRNNYGYKNLRSFPLMLDFCGLPYIDTRVSFNSFIPRDTNDELAERLANYYIDRLAEQPEKHDKVEFDIIFSCYTFDLPERLKALEGYGFSSKDRGSLRESLRLLTNGIINITDGLWITDSHKIQTLNERRERLINSDLDIISRIYWLLEDCTRYGTLPFAGLARAGFIAVLLLKSLVSTGILSRNDYENYIGHLNTVGSQMSSDREELSRTAFLRKYGHLRPGTYDITSPRYAAAPELYFGSSGASSPVREKPVFSLTLEQYEAIQAQMRLHGLEGDALSLFKFCKAGIEGREYSKFVFTRSLSDALELIAELGEKYGFSREDMAFANISIIDRLYSTADDTRRVLTESISEGRKKYAETTTFTMPPVILRPDDIYSFAISPGSPNFITLGSVMGDVCTDYSGASDMSGKILLIPSADPGYDWIFTRGIKGFITAYGGANSHMAIRAGELGVPAVIGAGEKLFNQWKAARTLHVDCSNKKVEIFR